MIHSRPCKVCKRPTDAEVPDSVIAECEAKNLGSELLEWVHRLAPMLTCKRCYDHIQERSRIEDRIAAQCYRLLDPHDKSDRAGIRLVLEKETQAYAQVVAAYFQKDFACWDPEFVEWLMAEPRSVKRLLAGYKDMIRKHVNPTTP